MKCTIYSEFGGCNCHKVEVDYTDWEQEQVQLVLPKVPDGYLRQVTHTFTRDHWNRMNTSVFNITDTKCPVTFSEPPKISGDKREQQEPTDKFVWHHEGGHRSELPIPTEEGVTNEIGIPMLSKKVDEEVTLIGNKLRTEKDIARIVGELQYKERAVKIIDATSDYNRKSRLLNGFNKVCYEMSWTPVYSAVPIPEESTKLCDMMAHSVVKGGEWSTLDPRLQGVFDWQAPDGSRWASEAQYEEHLLNRLNYKGGDPVPQVCHFVVDDECDKPTVIGE